MYLYNCRNKIFELFENKYLKPTNFSYNAKKDSELKYESEYEETNQSLKKLFQKEQKKKTRIQ